MRLKKLKEKSTDNTSTVVGILIQNMFLLKYKGKGKIISKNSVIKTDLF